MWSEVSYVWAAWKDYIRTFVGPDGGWMSSNYDHGHVKRLYRSRDDAVLGGVCGGIAKYMDIDPTVIRVIWVVFTLFYLIGLLVYIILYFVIPLEPEGHTIDLD